MKQGEKTFLRAQCGVRKIKKIALPTKNPPQLKQKKSHVERAEAMTQRALNETMLFMRKNEKKNFTVCPTNAKK